MEAAMTKNGYVKGKSKNDILGEMVDTAQSTSPVREQQKMGIVVRCTEDIEAALKSLENSMGRNAESSQGLAKKVYWLNVILATATALGTILALWKFFV